MITGGFVDFSIVVVDFILVSIDLEGQRSSVVGGLCFFWGWRLIVVMKFELMYPLSMYPSCEMVLVGRDFEEWAYRNVLCAVMLCLCIGINSSS